MSAPKKKKKILIFTVIFALVVIGVFVAMKAKGAAKPDANSPTKTGKSEVADIQVRELLP